jgi:large subunit ribosomal protein L6
VRQKFHLSVGIPEGVDCKYEDGTFECKKAEVTQLREISIPRTDIKIDKEKIKFECKKANKKDIAIIRTNVAHVNNLLKGLEETFVYKMEICNVHFPMTAKVEGNKIVVNNFLGEKISRQAKILDGVNVEIKGKDVTVSGNNIEKTGQTAANIEKATRVPKKDRRIFQDGIFITEKPGGVI